MDNLKRVDLEIFNAIESELERQQYNLELIASENIVSKAVLEACGSILTNKYAEGYPSKRYYGGCGCVDTVEQLAIDRLKELFNCEHANVQPHSGANANTAVYFAVLNPKDTVMGMSLKNGGHLTHGAKVNMSGKLYNFVPYGVDSNGFLDYEDIERIAIECQPKLIVAGASSYPRAIDFAKFRKIADKVGALLMVDMAHIAGLVATGLHQSPVPYADFVTSTTHKTLRGARGGIILCKQQYAEKIDKAVFPGSQGGPLMHIIAGKAVAFKEALTPEFKAYQKQIVANCKAMENALRKHGINMVSGGTDNHLLLLDLRGTGATGLEMEILLEQAHITVNKNSIPLDPEKANVTSGIRIGSAVLTSRGMKEAEMSIVIDLLVDVLKNKQSSIQRVKAQVVELCKKFPIYN